MFKKLQITGAQPEAGTRAFKACMSCIWYMSVIFPQISRWKHLNLTKLANGMTEHFKSLTAQSIAKKWGSRSQIWNLRRSLIFTSHKLPCMERPTLRKSHSPCCFPRNWIIEINTMHHQNIIILLPTSHIWLGWEEQTHPTQMQALLRWLTGQ